MSIEETNKKIVTEFWHKFSTLDFDGAVAMMADKDFTWWMGGEPDKFPLSGLMTKEKFLGLLQEILKVAPGGIQVTPVAWTVQGNRVAMEATSTAKTNSGKEYHNFYHFLIELTNDGKVQSVREYLDTMHTNDVFCKP